VRHAPEADPMRMHRVWIDGPFEGGSMVELHGGEVRRARKVLRLRQGDLVTVVQAGGVEGEAEVVELCPQRVVLRVRRVWGGGQGVSAVDPSLPGPPQGRPDGMGGPEGH
jgi:hypothetical protein